MAVYFGQEQGLGDLLGAGLGKGLNQLAQQKMQQMQTRKGLEGLLGPNMANQISQLPPDIAKQVIKQQLQNVQSQQRMNIFQQQYGGLQPGVNPGLEAITAGAQQPGQQQPGESATGLQSLQPGAQQPGAQQPGPANVGGYVPGKQSSLALALGVDPGKAMELEEKASSEQRKESVELRKERIAEQREIDKETLPYYDEVMKTYKGSKETERRIGRMEELTRKGDLDSPQFSSLLDTVSKGIFGFGINLDALRSPDSQEFKKLSVEFLKNAKNLFGPKVTQSEIEMFMQMVPTLQQSDKGKLRIINNMKAYADADKIKKTSMNQIIKENRGRRPLNLETLVEGRTEEQLDALAQQFKKGYNIEAEPKKEKSSVMQKLNPVRFNSALSGIADWLGTGS